MLRLAFDFIITWRETRTRPNAYENSRDRVIRLTVNSSSECLSIIIFVLFAASNILFL